MCGDLFVKIYLIGFKYIFLFITPLALLLRYYMVWVDLDIEDNPIGQQATLTWKNQW